MNLFARFVIFGWTPIVLGLFLTLPRRQALLAAFVGGWLFLPCVNIRISGMPDVGKVNVNSFAPLLAVLVFDATRLMRFRPSWRDLPALALCACPFFSSLDNGLGVHDGVSSVLTYVLTWGVPYFLGRVYLRDEDSVRLLARAIVIGGLLYLPLCLIEIRLSPQLHRLLYGSHQHSFLQTVRGTGWRPSVFMQHGLMVALWMAAAALVAVTLARARVLRMLFGFPAAWCAGGLVVTLILCKSVGAIVLFAIGWIVTVLARRRQAAFLLWLLILVPPIYVAGRVTGVIDKESVQVLLAPLPAERAESVAYRLKNEDPMLKHALLQPLFGWGGWGRSRILDDEGDDISTADSLWIEYLGRNGLVGLGAALALLMIGPVTFLQRFPPSRWLRREHAAVFSLAVVVVLFAMDCTMNAMLNPVYILAMGALVSLPRPARTPAPAPAPVPVAVAVPAAVTAGPA